MPAAAGPITILCMVNCLSHPIVPEGWKIRFRKEMKKKKAFRKQSDGRVGCCEEMDG